MIPVSRAPSRSRSAVWRSRPRTDVPLDNTVSYSFGVPIPPGGEAVVVFQAYAAHPGDWAGDFDFCIDSEFDFVSEHVRTLVTSAP